MLALSARHWPPVAISPRGILTGLTALTNKTPLARPATFVHRAWLGLLWRLRR
jgi:hypothetical protein